MPPTLSTLESVRRQAEQEMRREAPRIDGEQGNVKRRRLKGDDDGRGCGDDDDDDDDNQKNKNKSWLRFAYDGSSSLLGSSPPTSTTSASGSCSIVGFVVSSQIRKEMSAAREAKGRLCSLLGVPPEEEEEEEKEEEEEVEEVEEKGDEKKEEREGDVKGAKGVKAPPRLSATLSPVRRKNTKRERQRDEPKGG